MQSPRSRANVRAWFNNTEQKEDIQRGLVIVERELQRLGKTSTNLQELAVKLGFEKPEELFFFASKTEFHPRSIETAFEQKVPEDPDALIRARVGNLSEAKKQTRQDSAWGFLCDCSAPPPPPIPPPPPSVTVPVRCPQLHPGQAEI